MDNQDAERITPQVSEAAEFLEIVNDFGDPLEVLREAISNSLDAKASKIQISIEVKEIDGVKKLIIDLLDNGRGMSKKVLTKDFWGLGFSPSREDLDAIGEKGHGTKIYLRSEKVEVWTQQKQTAYYSVCEKPLSSLTMNVVHQPTIIPFIVDDSKESFTHIRIIGYNANERSRFIYKVVSDYILWFTKFGSVEKEFGINNYSEKTILLKCIDDKEFHEIKFGHVFAKEDSNIEKLFEQHLTDAAKHFVKKYSWQNIRLHKNPEVVFDAVIYVEGDEAKKTYNSQIRERGKNIDGGYRVRDRYGIWICKDYIPVTRVNEWISGFGSGSNAFVLLHGFINCQSLKLTANRGTIANTDPEVLEELQQKMQDLINEIDEDLTKRNLYTLIDWQEEEKTKSHERFDFERRKKNIQKRSYADLLPDKYVTPRIIFEPYNESELFGLFITLITTKPDLFGFQVVDYNTTNGIDLLVKINYESAISEGDYKYVELKYILKHEKMNHVFDYIRWLVCWDFDKTISEGDEFIGIDEKDRRKLERRQDDSGNTLYFLTNKTKATSTQVIRLKEYLLQNLGLQFIPRQE